MQMIPMCCSVVGSEGLNHCDHIFFVQLFIVHEVSGFRNVMFQDREQDKRGDTGGETSVIKHQTAVQGTGCGTHGSAHEAGGNACASAVAS